MVEARIRQNLAQGTFEFTNVGAHVFGDEEGHFFRHLRALQARLGNQNRHPHFQLGRLDGNRQAGIKARHQSLVNIGETFRVGIAGHHDMAFFGQQRFKRVEEFFLRSIFVGEELHIVNQQQIQRVVTLFELVKRLALVGFNHIRDELLCMDVENFGIGLVFQQFAANGVHQMGLAQTDAAIDEQWVVHVPRRGRHVHGGGARHAVGGALYQRVKRQRGIEAVLVC